MVPEGEQESADYGLIEPIAIPADSKVPNPRTGASTGEEYDRYFRLQRDNAGFVAWSETCLKVQDRVLQDLDRADLSPEVQNQILRGLLLVHRATLQQLVASPRPPSPEVSHAPTDDVTTDGD